MRVAWNSSKIVCHIVGFDSVRWYRLLSQESTLLELPPQGDDGDSDVIVVLGASLSSWRSKPVEGDLTDQQQFMFTNEILLDPADLEWSQVVLDQQTVSQAWISSELLQQCLSQISKKRVVQILFEPLSVSFPETTVWKSNDVLLSRDPSAPCAQLVSESTEPLVSLSGAILDTQIGELQTAYQRSSRFNPSDRSVALVVGVLCFVSVLLHGLARIPLYVEDVGKIVYPHALDWLEQLSVDQLGSGNVRAIRGIQQLQVLQIEIDQPLSNDQLRALQQLHRAEVTQTNTQPTTLNIKAIIE
jgi:hypothetical protein